MDAELEFEPGTSYGYSNVGYSLLAAVIEQVSGASYDEFVQHALFGPAGMTSTGYDLDDLDAARLARGYRGDEDFGTFADHPWADDGPYWHLRGNGGMLSTLRDLIAWHLALDGTDVLSREAKTAYFTPWVREGEGAPSFYGYGWVIQETDRGTLIWHDGGNPYFSSDFRRYVDEDVAIFVTSNTGDHEAFGIMPDIADIVFGEQVDPPPLHVEQIDPEDLDATPEGRRALALLHMLASDSSAVRPFIDEHIDPRLLDANPVDELAAGFRDDQRRIGAVEIGRVERPSEGRLELTVRSVESDVWRLLTVIIADTPSGRIVGFGVDGASPPGE
jgi:CubicO group peptidase (beta-lactamase class C family)